MPDHFLPRQRPRCRDGREWSMVRLGREVRSQTDYILGTDRRLFRNLAIWDPRHNSDHYMVLGCLRSAPLREHTLYLWCLARLPLRPPTTPTRKDGLFVALRRAIPKPKSREARKNTWISADTWRLIDERVSARRGQARDQTLI